MATLIVLRNIAPTYAASVTASSTSAATIPVDNAEIMALAAFLNIGSAAVAVNIVATGAAGTATAASAVFPVVGTPQAGTFVLPPLMTVPMVMAVPNGFSYTMIGAAAGPSLVYITPVGIQS